MKIADALTGFTQLGVDTAPFIYLLEKHPVYLGRVRAIFTQIAQGNLIGVSSVIALTEVLTQPTKAGNRPLAQAYRRILLHSRFVSLRTPDAIQLAASLQAGCEAFLTNDRGLARISEFHVLVLDDLEV